MLESHQMKLVLNELGSHPELYAKKLAALQKVVVECVWERLKDKAVTLSEAREMASRLSNDVVQSLIEVQKVSAVSAVLKRLDKHSVHAKAADVKAAKDHMLALLSEQVEPVLPPAKAKRAANSSKQRKATTPSGEAETSIFDAKSYAPIKQ